MKRPEGERAAVVLAGGRGLRLGGGTPKALRTLAGRTLLDRAVETASGFAGEVWVSVPGAMEVPEGSYRVVRDLAAFGPWAGPLIALASALGHVRQPWAAVLAADMPFAGVELLEHLWSRRDDPPTAADGSPSGRVALGVVPWLDTGPEPLLGLYRSETAPILLAAAQGGERSVVRAVAALPLVRVPEADLRGIGPGLEAFRNVNTAEEWEWAERRLSGSGP